MLVENCGITNFAENLEILLTEPDYPAYNIV